MGGGGELLFRVGSISWPGHWPISDQIADMTKHSYFGWLDILSKGKYSIQMYVLYGWDKQILQAKLKNYVFCFM